MVIFNSYVSLPEGTYHWISMVNLPTQSVPAPRQKCAASRFLPERDWAFGIEMAFGEL